MHVEAIYISPVKSLRLSSVERARVERRGIAGDRAFFVMDERGRVVTQREHGRLTLVEATYDVDAGRLRLAFPEGAFEGEVRTGEAVEGRFYGTPISGRVVEGPFDEALSTFVGKAVRLVKVDDDDDAFDCYPLSMCSSASVAKVRAVAGLEALDERRFRQNIYVAGAGSAHEEDTWVGREVRIGAATVRALMPDARCVMTTHDPDTGDVDIDTLGVIASYRTDQPDEVNFGVYCEVAVPAMIAVGDEVMPA
jgi:uncharacterized protein YcbX